MEVNLYDDELCDNGVTLGNFRYCYIIYIIIIDLE
jgi:hypothetical protein